MKNERERGRHRDKERRYLLRLLTKHYNKESTALLDGALTLTCSTMQHTHHSSFHLSFMSSATNDHELRQIAQFMSNLSKAHK
jgi:hypothetical protein